MANPVDEMVEIVSASLFPEMGANADALIRELDLRHARQIIQMFTGFVCGAIRSRPEPNEELIEQFAGSMALARRLCEMMEGLPDDCGQHDHDHESHSHD